VELSLPDMPFGMSGWCHRRGHFRRTRRWPCEKLRGPARENYRGCRHAVRGLADKRLLELWYKPPGARDPPACGLL